MSHSNSEQLKKIILKIRRFTILLVGLGLFTVSVLLERNVQLEGLVFGALTGVTLGAVTHYLLKLFLTLLFGRVWCAWACWTGALLDQLPYRKSAGWLTGGWSGLRYLHFALSCLLVLLVFKLGFESGALGSSAVVWFVVGNVAYWGFGVVLAVALHDNRAFCKYACPVSVVLKLVARPALLKISGDSKTCLECQSKACTTLCPMDIQIPEYIGSGMRLCSSECIACLQCVAICPPNTLKLSIGFDYSAQERLEARAAKQEKA
jgi:ferredoxin-type protein NapH